MKAVVDCNSFYCSCERLFRPELQNKPVVVLSNNDGCIISRTDEAKELGIKMGIPYYQAKEIIERNEVAVFSSNYGLYGDMSRRVMDTLRTIAGPQNVEVYSVDEAFLDLDEVRGPQLYRLAAEIKDIIEQWTGIKVSVGVAPGKLLSKLANRLAKKDKHGTGCIMVLDSREKISDALQLTPVSDLWGVGTRYAEKLKDHWGIYDAYQLSTMNDTWALKNLGGVTGLRLVRELRGESCMVMKEPLDTKKMIATTRMFGRPVTQLTDLKEAVATYISRAAEKLRRQCSAAGIVHVFLVTNDHGPTYQYQPQTRGLFITLPHPSSLTNDLIRHAIPLVEKLYQNGSRYLKAGVTLSALVPDQSIQGNLFAPYIQNHRRMLMGAIDNVNFSMRDDVVKFCTAGSRKNWKMRQELRSARYSTRWNEVLQVQ